MVVGVPPGVPPEVPQNMGSIRVINSVLCFFSVCLAICIYFAIQMDSCYWYGKWACYYDDIDDVMCCYDLCPSSWWSCDTP